MSGCYKADTKMGGSAPLGSVGFWIACCRSHHHGQDFQHCIYLVSTWRRGRWNVERVGGKEKGKEMIGELEEFLR